MLPFWSGNIIFLIIPQSSEELSSHLTQRALQLLELTLKIHKGIAAKRFFLPRGACLLSDYKMRLGGQPDPTNQQWRCCVFSCNLYFYYTFLKTEVWNQAWFLIPRVDSTYNPFRCFIPFFLFDTWIFFLHKKAVFVLTLMSKSAKRDYVWSNNRRIIVWLVF